MYITQGFVVFFVPLGGGDAVTPPPRFYLSLSLSVSLSMFLRCWASPSLSKSTKTICPCDTYLAIQGVWLSLLKIDPVGSRRLSSLYARIKPAYALVAHADISLRQVADASSALDASIFLDMVISPKEPPPLLLRPSHIFFFYLL